LLHGGLTARNDPAPPIRVMDAGKATCSPSAVWRPAWVSPRRPSTGSAPRARWST
jgi:hypothetical protein